jgi:cytochrome c peroxidase
MNLRDVLTLLSVALAGVAAAADQPWVSLPRTAPEPTANPATPAKVLLGNMLFHDVRLSESGTVACASCHDLKAGGADHQARSAGVHGVRDGRNALTIWNVGFLTSFFWDGHAATLESQARDQLLDPIDMGMKDLAYVTARIRSIPGYRPHLEQAFGPGDVVTGDNAVKAIAAFERSLVTPDTPYDRFVNGDRKALNEQQQRGMREFREAGCSRCHQGAAFDGPTLVAGTPFVMKFPTNTRSPYVAAYELTRDLGRYEYTGKDADRLQWRVPSLRNLKYTAPYMHNGSVAALADAVRVMGSTELSRTLTDAETADLVAFLESLSGPLPEVTVPALPASAP